MALLTWEERFASLSRRVVLVELEVPRIYGHVRTGEGLQDRQNRAVAERLLTLERHLYGK